MGGCWGWEYLRGISNDMRGRGGGGGAKVLYVHASTQQYSPTGSSDAIHTEQRNVLTTNTRTYEVSFFVSSPLV